MDIKLDEVKLSKEEEEELSEYLSSQLEIAINDRATLENDIRKWNDNYEGKTKAKNFPWAGCSNVFVPLTAIAVDAIFSRIIRTIFGIKPLWSIRGRQEGDTDTAQNIEDFLDYEFTVSADGFSKIKGWVLECVKLGTSVLKTTYERKTDKIKYYDDSGKIKEIEAIVYDSVKYDIIDLIDFIAPVNAVDEHTCQWVAQRVLYNSPGLRLRASQKIFRKEVVEKVLEWIGSQNEDGSKQQYKQSQEEAEGLSRTSQKDIDELKVYEIWLNYDVKKSGIEQKLVVTFHKDTKTILRIITNPYFHGKRPFTVGRFIARSNRFYARGVCQMIFNIQNEINTIHNQRMDNRTIANMKCFKARIGSGVKPGMQLYPGSTIFLDDPVNDLMEFNLGDKIDSTIEEEAMLREYAEKITGVTDYTLGRESSLVKSRATATGTMALIQEGNKKFDMMIEDIRNSVEKIGMQTIQLYQQFNPIEKEYRLLDKGIFTNIKFPQDYLPGMFDVSCTATSIVTNKEVEKENNLILLDKLGILFEKQFLLLQTMFTPGVPPEIKKYAQDVLLSSREIAKRLVRTFDIRDIEKILPEIPDMNPALDEVIQRMNEVLGGEGGMMGGQQTQPPMPDNGGGMGEAPPVEMPPQEMGT